MHICITTTICLLYSMQVYVLQFLKGEYTTHGQFSRDKIVLDIQCKGEGSDILKHEYHILGKSVYVAQSLVLFYFYIIHSLHYQEQTY